MIYLVKKVEKNNIKRKLLISLGIIIIIVLFLNNIYTPCIFHKLTGFYCPSCGITRCLISIINLDFYQAFRYNQLLFILFPFIASYTVYVFYIWLFNKEDKISKKIPKYIWYSLVIILILFGMIRNIDYFSWLAPTIIS